MKKKFLLTLSNLVLLLSLVTTVNAQFTRDANFSINVDIEGAITTLREGDCGFYPPEVSSTGPNEWGGPINQDICGQLVWVDGDTSNILGCDPITNDLTGKIALIRRGICNFSYKAYLAQQAGAVAVMIVNHSSTATENECTVLNMAAGTNAADVTIPVVFLARQAGNPIGAALTAGQEINVCFHLLRIYDAFAEYTHSVPVSQITPMDLISMSCVNRTGIEQEFNFKAEITDPTGAITTLERVDTLGIDSTKFISFDVYTPPAVEGLYTVRYSTDQATAVGDTLSRTFRITPNTWSTDNLRNIGAGARRDDLFATPLKYQTGSMVRTGPDGAHVKYFTFGISNPDTVRVADPLANVVNILLYDADANDDGVNDLTSNFSNLGSNFVAFTEYIIPEGLKPDSLITLELASLDGADDVTLEPNHIYYTVLSYDGAPAALGKMISFTGSDDVEYGQFTDGNGNSTGPAAPIQFATLSSWSGVKEVNRLHTVGYNPETVAVKPTPLDQSKYSVTPNPTADQISLNLSLTNENAAVRVALVDFTGQIVSTKIVRNFVNGRISFDAKTLPSGAYALLVTTEEGSTMVNVMVCH